MKRLDAGAIVLALWLCPSLASADSFIHSGGGSGGGSGDITDVWGCATGNCNDLTGASGDTLDAGLADSSKPATRSTALPGTCTEGQIHQDTDSGGSETYVCTAANTWTKLSTTTDPPGPHALLDTIHTDTVAGAPVAGDLLIGDSGNLWSSLGGPTSASERCFNSTGTGTAANPPYWGPCSEVKANTGTTYTILPGDNRKLLTFSNVSSIAVTLPQATTAGFADGFYVYVKSVGAGTATITPTTSTIDGAASLVLAPQETARIWSDGTNYTAARLGNLPVTSLSGPTDDSVILGNGSTWERKAVPDCTDSGGNHLNYTASSNTISCGTSGGGAGGLSTSTFKLEEEFCSGLNSAGNIGDNGLYMASGTFGSVTPVASHPCLINISTAATAGTTGRLFFGANDGNTTVMGDVQAMRFIVRPQVLDANTSIRCGFIVSTATTLEGSDGVYFSYLNSASANWRAATRVTSLTATNSTVAAGVGTWVQFDITRNGSNWNFSVNEAAAFATPATSTGPAATTAGKIGCVIETAAASAKDIDYDYFGWSTISPLAARHP